MSERRDPLVAMPELYVVAVNQLLRALFGRFFGFAKELYSVLYATVTAQQIGPVILHRSSRRRSITGPKYNRRAKQATTIFKLGH